MVLRTGGFRRFGSALLCLVGMASAAPSAWAGQTGFAIVGVSNINISCDPGNLQNCEIKNVPQVSCPTGEEPTGVTVQLGPGNMSTSVLAQNTSGFSSCYNIEDVTHTTLSLEVPAAGLVLNGALNNSDGSGVAEPDGFCDADWPTDEKFTYFRTAGQFINTQNILQSQKPAIPAVSYAPGDPNYAVFYGAGTFSAQFSAQAFSTVQQSGTWDGGVVTAATAVLTVTPQCESDRPPPPVPAIGLLGIGGLVAGLSGLGLMFGFRRRG